MILLYVSIYHMLTQKYNSHLQGDKRQLILVPNMSDHNLETQICP